MTQIRAEPRRRWLRRLAAIVAVLTVAVVAVYGWALASVDRSTFARAMVWRDADVGDQYRFPSRLIPTGEEASPLPAGPEFDIAASPAGLLGGEGFDTFLRTNDTLA